MRSFAHIAAVCARESFAAAEAAPQAEVPEQQAEVPVLQEAPQARRCNGCTPCIAS